jgi:hypothetical protein
MHWQVAYAWRPIILPESECKNEWAVLIDDNIIHELITPICKVNEVPLRQIRKPLLSKIYCIKWKGDLTACCSPDHIGSNFDLHELEIFCGVS